MSIALSAAFFVGDKPIFRTMRNYVATQNFVMYADRAT
jgi:hypothetical protein